MAICPLCNALEYEAYTCPTCTSILQDYGKTVDYIGPYSAYMDQELLEKVDGLSAHDSQQYCLHLLYCPTCEKQTEVTVQLI
ncbi:hypothetical protein [Bacillus rhizoplanae]|uniref:hypothetical protein n=1 Tax=Bacillus rhizoplanae TaxID=2880966 RepID=UPI003D1ABC2D